MMRSTTYSTIKPLIEDEYEDACYELAYSLEPILLNLIRNTGVKNNNEILKTFLKNKETYSMCKQINDELLRVRKDCEATFVSCQLDFASKLNEYYKCLVQVYMPIYMKMCMQNNVTTGL